MMGSLQPSYFQLLNLFIAALLECKAQTENPCGQLQQLNISYVQGYSMSISCLTTMHSLESLTVKLRKYKDILIYSDISPASEHQRWSSRKDAGNVTLDLKNITVSDEGLYDCQVYSGLVCINATQFNLTVKECKKLPNVYATSGSSVLLPCSEHPQQNTTDQVTWKVVTGHQSTEITEYRHPQKSTNSVPSPLYMRAKTHVNGSLLIRDAVNTDELWYQCVVNETTCYEVKLLLKDQVTAKSKTELPTTTLTTVSPVEQTEGHIDTSATNLTVVVMATIVSLCVFIALITCVILYFKTQKHKISSQSQLNNRFSVYYSCVAEDIDVPMYSLIEQTPAITSTCGVTMNF